jgi:hypothetical protein
MEWESSSNILITRNPNWSQRLGTETGCMKIKVFFFENRVFLIPDLYFYDIKIQTNLSLNDVEKSVEKSQNFKKYRYIIKKHTKKKK